MRIIIVPTEIFTVRKAVVPENTLAPQVVGLPGIVTVCSAVLLLNALSPTLVTVFGMINEVKPVALKADTPIASRFDGKFIAVSANAP